MRLAIRRTWANDTYYRKMGVARVLFLLGQVEDLELQMKMEAEFKEYRDMLQGDFRDSYRNLTHKGVMGYKWITERCRNAKFILKTDDDIVVNMFILFTRVLPKFENKTKQIVSDLERQREGLQEKIVYLQSQSMRSNLIFKNITGDNCDWK
ncbi:beta-1,3-galactosyltransferase 1-like [Dreissena polymorpha]|uniref:beta-1,3-galactosyltransferase 1-like n=1 Tax=Dreissena polymorpha TaxID=45954 RepID=UPI0022648382|nr:beta-1,3-galactosyltransferase 1-like [Dreissena polymorpha]